MATPADLTRISRAPVLTRRRIILALAIALVADGLQLVTGPLGWVFGDQIIDVIAMALTMWALGFHWLLLPTFVAELIPIVDMLPTWTACVIAVIALRKRAERARVRETNEPRNVPPASGAALLGECRSCKELYSGPLMNAAILTSMAKLENRNNPANKTAAVLLLRIHPKSAKAKKTIPAKIPQTSPNHGL
jgi:hypothetical protein